LGQPREIGIFRVTLKQVEEQNKGAAWNDLNQREREILPLLAKGLKNREIAAELFIAEATTRDYVSSILLLQF
jgi:two-component system response regulator DevR